MGADGDSAKLSRQTRGAAVAVVAGVALAAVAIWMRRPRLEPIEVSQQTTYIVTPTRADGWVDYPEAVDWMRRASLDAGGANAALPLLRALGRDVLPAGVDRSALLKRLGVAEAAVDAGALTPLDGAKDDASSPPEPAPATLDWLRARCAPGASSPPSLAKLSGWLARSAGALKDLREAAESASLYVPVPRGAPERGDFDRINPIRLADGAAVLACAAAMKLVGGEPAESWSDANALWRLGQLVARGGTSGEAAVAERLWRAALIATVDLAASPSTGPELLSAMQAGLGAKLGFPPATETWMFQRLSALEANGTPLMVTGRTSAPPLARVGTGAKLEAINQQFDAVDVALQTPDPKQRIARVEQAGPAAALQLQGGGIARGVLAVELQAASCQRLASLAITLARRQRDGGKLPASLAELRGAPKDPATGGAFNFRVDGAQFRLYGAGGDGNDDHGDPERDVVADAKEPPRLATR